MDPLTEEEQEIMGYLTFCDVNGVPQIGPDTIVEYMKKVFYAKAYVKSWKELIYGKEPDGNA